MTPKIECIECHSEHILCENNGEYVCVDCGDRATRNIFFGSESRLLAYPTQVYMRAISVLNRLHVP